MTETVTPQFAAEDLSKTIQKSGLLIHKKGTGHLDFQFIYHGYPFVVRAEAWEDKTMVDIRTILGNMPYSAESYKSRVAVAKILAAINDQLGFRMALTLNQRLILSDNLENAEPLTPTNLLSMVTLMLLRARPYLDLLAEYVKPSGETVKPFRDSRSLNVNFNPAVAG